MSVSEPGVEADQLFTESLNRSNSLLSRYSRRKTAQHFSWNCSKDALSASGLPHDKGRGRLGSPGRALRNSAFPRYRGDPSGG
ncbi:hypothetical protein FP026_12970 [Rhizobium tropici]|uniref:Uncharacterized protein n=1 Tax=Rhizobium tropici TaxID=398 RepID=A0A5B0W3Q8_RHITR|nr:hypothetical protein FP026_12970 [Rhizobium tropici]